MQPVDFGRVDRGGNHVPIDRGLHRRRQRRRIRRGAAARPEGDQCDDDRDDRRVDEPAQTKCPNRSNQTIVMTISTM